MPIVDGFSQYSCDRCGRTAFVQGENQASEWTWNEINEEMLLFCGSCTASYERYADDESERATAFRSAEAALYLEWFNKWQEEQGEEEDENPTDGGVLPDGVDPDAPMEGEETTPEYTEG